MKKETVNKIGWLASITAITMYFSYIDQIRLNLSGQTGSIILPLVTMINCLSWSCYGFFKVEKDWPIIVCNLPGILLGLFTALTAIL